MARRNRNSGRITPGSRTPPTTVRKKKNHRRTPQTCNGKVRFRDKAEADRALHLIANRNTRSKIPGRAYACPRCRGWHLTAMLSHPDME
jgi:hypothetical protein